MGDAKMRSPGGSQAWSPAEVLIRMAQFSGVKVMGCRRRQEKVFPPWQATEKQPGWPSQKRRLCRHLPHQRPRWLRQLERLLRRLGPKEGMRDIRHNHLELESYDDFRQDAIILRLHVDCGLVGFL
jgi:hypothetical protein